MRNEKGITLIALILSVIVLIVLAAVSVTLMLSNENDETYPKDPVLTDERVFGGENTVEDLNAGNTMRENTTVEGNTTGIQENLVNNTIIENIAQ